MKIKSVDPEGSMRTLPLLVGTLLASQFAFAAAGVASTPIDNIGTAEPEPVRNEALANDPGNRPPPSAQLAFVRDHQIYRVNSDGTGLTRLTNTRDAAANRDPAWSRDGQRLAFARRAVEGGADENWDIYLMNADGSNIVQLTNGGYNVEPAWGPNDRTIVFTTRFPGSVGLSVADTDADDNPGARDLLNLPGWEAQPAWSPDGRTITFSSDYLAYDIFVDLFAVNADGSDVHPLLEGQSGWGYDLTFYFQSAWSPDGQRIAVAACPSELEPCAIAVANADGSGLREIAQDGNKPTWSPDGRWIAYGSSVCSTCPSSVMFVQVDTGAQGLVVDNGHSPAWRPAYRRSHQRREAP